MYKFSREERLRKSELRKVFSQGTKSVGGYLSLYFLQTCGEGKKAAFVVRGCRNSAVGRNRCKRLLREVYRLNKHKLKENVCLILIIKKPDYKVELFELEKQFLQICRKSKIII